MKRLLTPVALIVAVAVHAPRARADAPRSWAVTIPFELLDSGHMVIRVKVNGRGPYRVIFDTGAPAVIFSGKLAKESGALARDRKPLLLGNYGDTRFDRIQVGDFTIKNVKAQVMDHPTVEALAAKLGPLDGLVGFPLLAPARLTIDYQARTITFVPRPPSPEDDANPNQAVMGLLAGKTKPAAVAPSAQWGLVVTKKKGDDKAGVDVQAVLPGSAAAAAGLRPGDRLLTLSGRWTDSVEDLYRAAGHVPAAKPAKLTIRRDGKEVGLTVTPRTGL